MKNRIGRASLALGLAGIVAGYSGGASAAAFALIEQSGSGMGNAYAGGSAAAEDASTIFFNPAGMSRIAGRQMAIAGHAIRPTADFTNTGSTPPLGIATVGGNGGDAGDWGFVPNFYYVMDVNPRTKFGFGINVPFGLKTEYDANWAGRFQGVLSELETINVNPAVSFKATEAISIGVGVNYQKIDAKLTNARVLGLGIEGLSTLEADDDGWGWNVGALFQAGPATRIGAAYRSSIKYELEGSAVVSRGSAIVAAVPITADARLPDTFSLSVVHQLNPRWEIMADWTRTKWSTIQTINIVSQLNGATVDALALLFDDSNRYSVGANYRYSDSILLRAGLAYDETPVRDATTRTVRIPDNDRTWLAVGAQWKVGKAGAIDVGYSHLFIDDADINQTLGSAAARGRVLGNYEADVNIISIQYTHNF